jgi:phosphorylcholine metabolism protein LicD
MQKQLQRHGIEALKQAVPPRAFLVYGTLLGMVREDRLIPHDDDMDVGVLEEEWDDVVPDTIPGFRRFNTSTWTTKFAHKKTGLVVDFFRFRLEGNERVANAGSNMGVHEYRFPREMIEPFKTVEWKGREWQVPADAKGFLLHHYGENWRTPNESWDYRTDATSDKAKQSRE